MHLGMSGQEPVIIAASPPKAMTCCIEGDSRHKNDINVTEGRFF